MLEKSKILNELPIKKYKREILYAVDNNDITVIIAETGTGKTTQIPQFLIQAGYAIEKRVAVSLPRRIACTSISKRVSEELGCHGGQIAYSIRFDTTANEHTKIKFLTDGMLLQQMYSDPLLEAYSVIMLDDIHERSLNTDMLIGFLKKIMYKRQNQLKLIISSATLQGQHIQNFFKLSPNYKDKKELKVEVINIAGRVYPVDVYYLKEPTKNYILKAFQTVTYIEQERPKGDVVVFLTSQEEIEAMNHLLDNYCRIQKRRLNVIPLHSSLPQNQQQRIFEHSLDRKIILSTNISQSSITIDNLYYVVDTGFIKVKVYDTEKSVETLMIMPCGKSSARQRLGRAGRVKKGECYRIYTQEAFNSMAERLPPEILRIDLSNYILKLKGLGIEDITNFEVMDPPSQYSLVKAIQLLYAHHLIDEGFLLTEKGKKVAELSLQIKLAVMLINSFDARFGCSEEILILVSMLSVERDIFVNGPPVGVLKGKKKIGAKEGDFVTLVNIFLRYRNAKQPEKKRFCHDHRLNQNALEHAIKIHHQLAQQLKSFNRNITQEQEMMQKYGNGPKITRYVLKSSHDDIEPILRCILTGFFMNVAQLQPDGSYKNVRSKETLWLHPTSILTVVYPQWIVYYEIVKNNKYYLYHSSKIQLQWLFQLAGHYYKDSRKEQAQQKYGQEMDVLKKVAEKSRIVSVGLQKIEKKKEEKQGFNTTVLGLKDKTELLKGKKIQQLSFDMEDI